MLTDIEIAKSVKLRPINEVAAELGIHEDQVENFPSLRALHEIRRGSGR